MNALVAIINHNRKAYTNQLFESLNPYTSDGYTMMVLDNGSTDKSEISEYTTHATDKNCYYGGALNLIFAAFLETDCDSLVVFNNDVIIHGPNYIKSLYLGMHNYGHAMASPCILQPEVDQCFWRTMHNWKSSEPRNVPWVDFMAPMFKRYLVEEIQQYDNELIYGWGQDVYTGLVCSDKGWTIGVLDTVSAIHLSSQTFKDGKSDLTLSEYGQKAMNGMQSYFDRIGRTGGLHHYRNLARNYVY